MEKVADVTDQTFEQSVLRATVPVVVDFWAKWCRPCLVITPWLDAFASDLGDFAKIVKAEAELNAAAVAKFGIIGLPTLLVFKDGELVSRQTTTLPRAKLGIGFLERLGINRQCDGTTMHAKSIKTLLMAPAVFTASSAPAFAAAAGDVEASQAFRSRPRSHDARPHRKAATAAEEARRFFG